ncbi:hypothetical protein THRCLA_02615 [Thraustotheca clavata]|uniref:BTB domain-containing protein n=1 Tax=Thraustotheca clavata TaxID=74557 RepID=A0A1W0A4L7_9STRA|nr:hypothetical protein THRCLA_02615 [Thraustotheca clavata]
METPREEMIESFHDHSDLSERLSKHNFRKPDSECCCDVILRVGTSRFYAHRFMLGVSSKPLCVMLTGPMRESKELEVAINGISSEVMELLLTFIYTGNVELSTLNVVPTMAAAEMYELSALREACKQFALRHAKHIFRRNVIEPLPEKLLCELVADENLQIRESTLLDAVLIWGAARIESEDEEDERRGPQLQTILQDVLLLIRFPTMSVRTLYGTVKPLVQKQVIPESYLTEALFFHLNWGAAQSPEHQKRMTPRPFTLSSRKRKRVSFIQTVSFSSPPDQTNDTL